MRYIAKVIIVTQEKEYKKGDKLPGTFPKADLERLKKQGFVYSDSDVDDNLEEEAFGYNEDEQFNFLSEKELRKLNKDKLVEYAVTIGLELVVDEPKEQLISTVLNYIEEQQAEA